MPKGLFIVFEGIDGSGTTTQCERLVRYLEEAGHPVICTREPGGTPLAERIRTLVLDPDAGEVASLAELFLYAASRAQHVHELIKPALQEGKVVVCDRFAASTLAYQGYGRGLDLDLVRQVNNYAVGDCWPDLTIILDVPLEVARQRRQHRANRPDRLEREGDLLQERVCRAYREIAHKEAGAVLLDARLGIEEVAEQVRRKLHSRWPGYPFGPKRGEE